MISKKVYIATDGFVAFIDREHPQHLHAGAQFRYFAQHAFQLYASIVTINETYSILYQTISPSLAKDFLRVMELTNINVLYPEESDLKKSLRIVVNGQVVQMTFEKALLAVLCNKKSITQVCTFDYLPTLFGLQLFYLPILQE